MQAVSVAKCVQRPSKDHLRLSVLLADLRHDEGSPLWGDVIGHLRMVPLSSMM